MNPSDPTPYLPNAVLTASPEQLHMMLIDDALRELRIHRKTWELLIEKVSAARAGEPEPPHTRTGAKAPESETLVVGSINGQG